MGIAALVILLFAYKAVQKLWFNDRTLLQLCIIVAWWAHFRITTICPVDLEIGDLAYDDIVLPYPDDYVEPEHIMLKWQRESPVRTMVIAHRGGYWGPENSWKSMIKAVELDSEGLEFDVSEIFNRYFSRKICGKDVLLISSTTLFLLGLGYQRRHSSCTPRRRRRRGHVWL